MLTPRFTISQTDSAIEVSIRAPFAKISETEIDLCDNELHFFSKPYHLRLYFQNDLDDFDMTNSYDSDLGESRSPTPTAVSYRLYSIFTIIIPKKVPGTHFTDLEMLTKLLTPPGSWSVPQHPLLVAEANPSSDPANGVSKEDTVSISDSFDWTYPQSLPDPSPSSDIAQPIRPDSLKYGFGLGRSSVLKTLTEELSSVIEIEDIDDLTPDEVRERRLQKESADFDDDHYLADLYNDDEIQEFIAYQRWWNSAAVPSNAEEAGRSHFDEIELDVLKELPRIPIALDQEKILPTVCILIEIVFGYAYDIRTNMGTSTVESSWTISKLSPSLSCLDSTDDVKDCVISALRRSLIYPLYRNYALSLCVLEDTKKIFSLGRWALLKCLLAVWKLFANSTDNRYILNDLYITSYCIWIQNAEDSVVADAAAKLDQLQIRKEDLGLELDVIEKAGELAMEEQHSSGAPEVCNVEEMMEKLRVVDSDDEEPE